jgi:hypothetical protein
MNRNTVCFLLTLVFIGLATFLILLDMDTNSSSIEIDIERNMELSMETTLNQIAVSLPTDLHDVVKEQSNQLIAFAEDKAITVVITDGFRSVEEQTNLYEQGRTVEGNIVTNVQGGASYHNY